MTIRTISPREAQMQLDALSRCRQLMPQGGGEDAIVCLRDEFPIVWDGHQYAHDPERIRELRAIASEGRWP